MYDPQTLISIIEKTITRQTSNWIGPWMARGIAEDIVSQISTEPNDDKLTFAHKAALNDPDNQLSSHLEYAVEAAFTAIRERDEYLFALDKIIQSQKSGKPYEPYEIARSVLETNTR
jgi:hypothetical protein